MRKIRLILISIMVVLLMFFTVSGIFAAGPVTQAGLVNSPEVQAPVNNPVSPLAVQIPLAVLGTVTIAVLTIKRDWLMAKLRTTTSYVFGRLEVVRNKDSDILSSFHQSLVVGGYILRLRVTGFRRAVLTGWGSILFKPQSAAC